MLSDARRGCASFFVKRKKERRKKRLRSELAQTAISRGMCEGWIEGLPPFFLLFFFLLTNPWRELSANVVLSVAHELPRRYGAAHE
jgi:hypothetical protein